MKHETKNKKILLTGGGTGGSVAPLLAVAEDLDPTLTPPLVRGGNNPLPCQGGGRGRFDFMWLGTKNGPERGMVEKGGIKFKPIASGKLRRYFSWKNLVDPFLIIAGFIQAFFIMLKWRPNLVMSAGSFVSVPVVWAAWLLKIPVLIHQQDARPGLSNKLMAPFARVITVTFEKSLNDYGKKAVWTGNPVRQSLTTRNTPACADRKQETQSTFNFSRELPVVLIIGGGTGALAINQLVEQSLNELTTFCQIIHITGKNKILDIGYQILNYKQFEFLNSEQMAEAYAAADIVVSRCGMGVLTELSYLGKPAILIPIPDSHQEDNAKIFKEQNAAIVLDQKELTPEKLVENIRKLIKNKAIRDELSRNISQAIRKDANKELLNIVKNILEEEIA